MLKEIKVLEEVLRLSQQQVLDFLQTNGALSKETAVPSRRIWASLKKANYSDTLARLRRAGEVSFDLREHGRFYYWLPRRSA